MANELATQLVTVGATLGGVVLTLVGSALVERRRAREARQLESLRLTAEHTRWLRDERMRVYAAFTLAVEEVLNFLRVEEPTAARWHELRGDLRKAYNEVQLLGADEPRATAERVWLMARNGVSELLRTPEEAEPPDQLRARLGRETNKFLEACRGDLQRG